MLPTLCMTRLAYLKPGIDTQCIINSYSYSYQIRESSPNIHRFTTLSKYPTLKDTDIRRIHSNFTIINCQFFFFGGGSIHGYSNFHNQSQLINFPLIIQYHSKI